MDLLRDLVDRLALDRAEAVGLAIALVGAVLATVVALRVPLGLADGPTPVVPGVAVEQSVGPVPDDPLAPAPAGELLVHVAGAVARPGVVRLEGGARVGDAVEAAGGALPGAALDALNLARPLVDGEQVLVPDEDAAVPGPGGPAGGGGAVLPDGRIDLNAATAADLEQLPGVGEVTAGRILAWREEHGPFTDPAQLREVRGIGETTWIGLRDLVAVR